MSVLTATNSTCGDAGVDHPVDSVQAGAADADDADHGEVAELSRGAAYSSRGAGSGIGSYVETGGS